ncbi:DUF397 domain-containing protein [Nocardia otitidiscaviarum]|uniref:DUF397 domain-containing protein n=1 Tax=Nocardia otitidiscaviarum TaxID=1823 RepID=UPI0004A73D95|nr:DUF397 domain-containing protein [Nocardia otitidiscaviarum]MBF6134777.1 DUF397 domain-containing protein [Nocardia otitidiscaviarum]MBF6485597.1 DUF397 domain-containing protein [Nocardia otitidiscaviarum]
MSDTPSAVRWFKSSHSQPQGDCVEAAHLPGGEVGVRDSKDTAGAVLIFGGPEWDDFTAAVRSGAFDLPA